MKTKKRHDDQKKDKRSQIQTYFLQSDLNVSKYLCPDFRQIKTFDGTLAPAAPTPQH